MNEIILFWHLYQVISLLSQSSHRRKDRDVGVPDTRVALGVQLDDQMSQCDCSTCPSYTCAAMHDSFLILVGSEDHEGEYLEHALERLE